MVFRRSYSREYKIETVKPVTEAGDSQMRVASDLGIHRNTLCRWVRQYEERPQGAFPGKGHQLIEAEELRQLQCENGWLRMERDILEKRWPSFPKTRSEVSFHSVSSGPMAGGGSVQRARGLPEW
jgi:transposase